MFILAKALVTLAVMPTLSLPTIVNTTCILKSPLKIYYALAKRSLSLQSEASSPKQRSSVHPFVMYKYT